MSLIGLILTLVVVGVLLWLSTTTYRWIRRSRRSSTSWSSSGCRGLELRALDQRGRLLRAALGFAGLPRPSYDRALWALRTWLDSWSGIGRIAVGMARQGFDLQLTRYDERGWRATFYTTGIEHSPTSATGTGWGRTLWHATQRAAWEALDGVTLSFRTLLHWILVG